MGGGNQRMCKGHASRGPGDYRAMLSYEGQCQVLLPLACAPKSLLSAWASRLHAPPKPCNNYARAVPVHPHEHGPNTH